MNVVVSCHSRCDTATAMQQRLKFPSVGAAVFAASLATAHAQATDKDLFAGFCIGVTSEAMSQLSKPGNDPSSLQQATNAFQRYRDYLMARGYAPWGWGIVT